MAPPVFRRTEFNNLVDRAITQIGSYHMLVDGTLFRIIPRGKKYVGQFDLGGISVDPEEPEYENDEPYGVVCDATESKKDGAPYDSDPRVEAD